MFRKVLFQVHWFIGITAGIVLAIVGLTGGMIAFEQEILRQINSNVMSFAAGAESALTPADLIERIQAQSPGKSIASLTLFSSREEAARVGFAAKPPEPGAARVSAATVYWSARVPAGCPACGFRSRA